VAPFARHAGERELIAFDAPGAGLSQRPRRPLRMRGLARVVAELLDALGLGRVDVLGYSFGGGLAQELAHRAPERVRRLVLCATAPGLGGVPPKPMAALMLATPARYYHPRLLQLSLAHIAGGRTRREPAVLAAHASERLLHPPSPLGYAYQLYAAAGWSSLPWLHRIKHPTLVIAGENDPSVPLRNGRLLAARIPDSRDADLIVIGATTGKPLEHMLLRDDAREVLEDPPCAVAVAPVGYFTRSDEMSKIGVGYDGSSESERALALARKIAARCYATLSAFEAVPPRLAPRDLENPESRIEKDINAARRRIAAPGDVEPHAELADDAVDGGPGGAGLGRTRSSRNPLRRSS
jgi:pimeloyl-ACP methyl ester carboxylesterase